MLPTTESRQRYPVRSWKSLPLEQVERRLEALGLHHDQPEQALICTRCKYALKPSGETVSKHLWEKHQIPPEERHGLSAYVKDLHLTDPNQLPLRQDRSEPHPHLSILSGAECRQCGYRSTSAKLVGRHVSKVHDRKRKRSDWVRDEIIENLGLQSWTQNGPRQYWIVSVEASMSLLGSLEDSPRRRQRVNALHEQEHERLMAQSGRVACDDTGIDDLASTSNWMRRTKWAETYRGVNRRLLLSLRQAPARDGHKLYLGRYGLEEVYSSESCERQLAAVDRAVDRFFSRCEDTIRHTDHSVLCWLRGQIVGRPYKAPFDIPARKSTIVKYCGIWKSMLFFYIRLFQVEPRLRHEFLRFTPSRAQSEACQELLAVLESMTVDPATTSYDNSTFGHVEIASRAAAVEQDTGLARWSRDSESRPVLPDSQGDEEESHMDPSIVYESSSDEATDTINRRQTIGVEMFVY
jgi:hypothetical protein